MPKTNPGTCGNLPGISLLENIGVSELGNVHICEHVYSCTILNFQT